ncbi:MAG: glycosyltransferase family 2 protein [Desulfomonilia bacterium]|nr:glycosyltransferase family 2 protein [Pseudomonadota bacterium]HON38733.1 glycosyltransferase family 2 protein [Deltaproteobacteria bacterium]HRS56596.1 glycosyltransferase family 2 protein [Desulfomonilia bacterium]HPD21896.1 glycosyltransferase family 2 protein [Deltaproteobacteria bacterium]HPX18471.1 glycosyltransferase family 2 protein [Deltaproteobacteria bacterium]
MNGRDVVLSVVMPFYNEEECIEEVVSEVGEVLAEQAGLVWELILVDDGSTDRTPEILDSLELKGGSVRVVHLWPNSGQSAALEAGFAAACGELVATLDGDGQNDPRDILRLKDELEARRVDMMCGIRRKRADNMIRRVSSVIANRIRSGVLKDNITDVGCSVRVFRRECLGKVRFFRNAHRFFPALFIMAGYRVAEMPVNHRARLKGTSKYGRGINSRLWAGIVDLAGVAWLRMRSLKYTVRETR